MTRTRLYLLAGIWLLTSCSALGFVRYGLFRVNSGNLWPGRDAPDIALVTLEGEPVQLHSYRDGKPLVLVFGSFT